MSNEHYEKGRKTEHLFRDFLKLKNITNDYNEVDKNSTIEQKTKNKKLGDFTVYDSNDRHGMRVTKYQIDVKSTWRNIDGDLMCLIALDSVEGFEGDYFLAIDESNIEDSQLLYRTPIQKYFAKITHDKLVDMPSGSGKGYPLNVTHFYSKEKLSIFIKYKLGE
jgi:hypothetical protein